MKAKFHLCPFHINTWCKYPSNNFLGFSVGCKEREKGFRPELNMITATEMCEFNPSNNIDYKYAVRAYRHIIGVYKTIKGAKIALANFNRKENLGDNIKIGYTYQ